VILLLFIGHFWEKEPPGLERLVLFLLKILIRARFPKNGNLNSPGSKKTGL